MLHAEFTCAARSCPLCSPLCSPMQPVAPPAGEKNLLVAFGPLQKRLQWVMPHRVRIVNGEARLCPRRRCLTSMPSALRSPVFCVGSHGVPHRIPEHISIWECLQPGAYDVILNQTILDVILPMHTRTADLVEEELRAEQAAGGDYGEGPSGARGPRRAFAARMAHKALASLCAMLRPGGTLLLVAQRPPEEALLVLSSGFGAL